VGDPKAVGVARSALDDLIGDADLQAFQSARLLVSELVTNALRHGGRPGGGWIELSAVIGGGVLRVEVCDPGSGFEATPTIPSGPQASGWGLLLVSRLAARWGTQREDGRFCVWFEIPAAI
jgi:anti-sigma regulatory factor (Ser/Thr protein kinase)